MKPFWNLKACPRCGGDLFTETDLDGWQYATCLQCSYSREISAVLVSREIVSPGPAVILKSELKDYHRPEVREDK